ncbi:MAG TPA: type I methionyl aminopeptidase [Candidatus Paceibacterota bacterium]
MIVRTPEQRAALIEGGKRLGTILETIAKAVAPGVSTEALDEMAERLIRDGGDEPSFLGYTPEGFPRAYPASLCVSVNDEVVHGIPNEHPRILKAGDIVSLDLGLTHEGIVVDSALTVPVGKLDKAGYALLSVTAQALEDAMRAAQPGARVGDISHATERAFVGSGFSVVKALGGHGVGGGVHEEPYISNAGKPGTGPVLEAGMVLALEPISSEGKAAVMLASDGYTYRTKDGSRAAHFEHTILVEESGPLIVTRRPSEAP